MKILITLAFTVFACACVTAPTSPQESESQGDLIVYCTPDFSDPYNSCGTYDGPFGGVNLAFDAENAAWSICDITCDFSNVRCATNGTTTAACSVNMPNGHHYACTIDVLSDGSTREECGWTN